MFTEKDLIAGKTVLVSKAYEKEKVKYLGNAGLIHFVSHTNGYSNAGMYYTIEQLNNSFTIEKPKSRVVPLEKKVYDFVPVRVRDNEDSEWENAFLIAVIPNTDFPYNVLDDVDCLNTFKYCELIN